jgi:hypothetical protein
MQVFLYVPVGETSWLRHPNENFQAHWQVDKNKQSATPQWIVTRKTTPTETTASEGELLRLNISKLKTQLQAGYANLSESELKSKSVRINFPGFKLDSWEETQSDRVIVGSKTISWYRSPLTTGENKSDRQSC